MALQRVARCWAGQAVGPFLFSLPRAVDEAADPSSPLLVLVSPRGPRESRERVHRTWGPGGTCYASRLVFITFIIKLIIRLLLLFVYEIKFMPLLLYVKLFISIIIIISTVCYFRNLFISFVWKSCDARLRKSRLPPSGKVPEGGLCRCVPQGTDRPRPEV